MKTLMFFLILNACGGTVDMPDAEHIDVQKQPDVIPDVTPDVAPEHRICITDPINGAGFYDDGCTPGDACSDDAGNVGICK